MANDNQGPLVTGMLLAGGGLAGYMAGRRFIDRWLPNNNTVGGLPPSVGLPMHPAVSGGVKVMRPASTGSPPARTQVTQVRGPDVPLQDPIAPPPPPAASVMSAVRTRFDPLFERHRGSIPLEYLRALAMRESDMNPGERSGVAWGLMQIVEVVRLDYNRAHGTRHVRSDLLNPAINVAIATWLLQLIMRNYERHHPKVLNLQTDWRNARFVELLTFGWNAGFSEAGGVGRVARFLGARGTVDITIELVHQFARAAGASRHLSRGDKVAWCKSVVALYQRELARREPQPHTAPAT